ncbi:glutathione S-transferase family protein [Bradyrhizobium prioriisuperbiae]|uniref:glutathione S-transferase family protein n=1 Tax=Bradyrhizobium prioriisuperbiae TaxID=2854389 RepID=UPI0028EFA591|nr:glutathione S-transferase family protein [Bradyrhizobium prioritasuperba]
MDQVDLILHHYPRSPFAEKVRVALGLKGLRWRSVEQPRIAPKPLLTALTGGYRRIPVLQIGADIFCDTRRILAELDRRYPEPPLYPSGTDGLADIIAAWADRELFATALGLVFGLHGDRFPTALHADRARLTAGRFDGWDSAKMAAMIPTLRERLRRDLSRLEHALTDGRRFLLGVQPSVADLAAYHPLWYARGNLGEDDAGLVDHPRLIGWMTRLEAIGHGTMQELAPDKALAIAHASTPLAVPPTEADDPHASEIGARVTVTPDDWGFDPVAGELAAISGSAIALKRHDPAVGEVVVHFPRDGFGIELAN